MLFMVLCISCEQEPTINYGFNSPVDKNSSGLAIADIPKTMDLIYLNGCVWLSEGEIEVTLVNPKGVTLFTRTISAPNEFLINETFNSTPGYWKLKYESVEGVGSIDLHIHR